MHTVARGFSPGLGLAYDEPITQDLIALHDTGGPAGRKLSLRPAGVVLWGILSRRGGTGYPVMVCIGY